MQNTRLNNLFAALGGQLGRWLFNPWRRLSLLTISLLFGFFLGTAVSTTTGQLGDSDIIVAGVLVAFIEIIDRIYYRPRSGKVRSFWVESLNALKIGLTYSLFIEAFKLGS